MLESTQLGPNRLGRICIHLALALRVKIRAVSSCDPFLEAFSQDSPGKLLFSQLSRVVTH